MLDPNGIKHIVFQGGGGKGLAYLGALRALKDRFEVSCPGFLTGKQSGTIGIGGVSAGAITAFLVACKFPLEDKNGPNIVDLLKSPDANFKTLLEETIPGVRRTINRDGSTSNRGERLNRSPASTLDKVTALSFRINPIATIGITNSIKNSAEGIAGTLGRLAGIISLWKADADSKDPVVKLIRNTILFNNTTVIAAFTCLSTEFGLFSGVEMRLILNRWMLAAVSLNFKGKQVISFKSKQLVKDEMQEKALDGRLTFEEFFAMTNVDLRVTGTNVTTGRPFVFSVHNSKGFSVTEAVGISMTIPFVFKPVSVGEDIGNVKAGLWVDGGVLNNLPLHVFDSDGFGGGKVRSVSKFNKTVMALQLVSGTYPDGKTNDSATGSKTSFFDYCANLGAALLYPSSDGQVHSEEEGNHVIKVFCGSLSTLDFDAAPDARSKAEDNAERSVRAQLSPSGAPGSSR